MARVEISLNGQKYGVACEDGQEGRLSEVASFVDARMRNLAASKPNAAETQLLVLATLTLADQIFDLRADLAKAKTANSSPAAIPAFTTTAYAGLDPVTEEKYASLIESLANRIDSVATRLARA